MKPTKRKNVKRLPSDESKFQLKFIDSYIGSGVFAREFFEKGEILLEYKGRMTTDVDDEDETGFRYYFEHDGKTLCIDATHSGGLGRMVNDERSRKANCKMKKLIIDGIPRLWLCAMKNISPGQQLTYDYGVNNLPWRKLKKGDVKPVLYQTPKEVENVSENEELLGEQENKVKLKLALEHLRSKGDVEDGDDEVKAGVEDGDDEVKVDVEDGDDEVKGDVEDGDDEVKVDVEDGDDEVKVDVEDGDDEVKGDVEDGDDEVKVDVEDGDDEVKVDVEDGDDEVKGDVEDGDDEVKVDVEDGDDEVKVDVEDGDDEVKVDVEDGDDEVKMDVEDGDDEVKVDVEDGDDEVKADVEDCNDEVKAGVEDGEDEVKVDVEDGDDEVKADVEDGDDEVKGDVEDGDDEVKVGVEYGDDEVKGDVEDGDDEEKGNVEEDNDEKSKADDETDVEETMNNKEDAVSDIVLDTAKERSSSKHEQMEIIENVPTFTENGNATVMVSRFVQKYNMNTTEDFNPLTTHVIMNSVTQKSVCFLLKDCIMNSDSDHLCVGRTMKFLQGIAHQCWILDFKWITDSLETGFVLPEKSYEIVGEKETGVTYCCRLSRMYGNLLRNWKIQILQMASDVPYDTMWDLVDSCGGTIVFQPGDSSDNSLIIRNSEKDTDFDEQRQLSELSRPVVDRMWLFDSIVNYQVQELKEYLIADGTQNQTKSNQEDNQNAEKSTRMLVDPSTGELIEWKEKNRGDKKVRQMIDPATGLLAWLTDEDDEDFNDYEADAVQMWHDTSSVPVKSPDHNSIKVQHVSASYRGLRDYSKEHCCIFCEKMVLKMARHLLSCHSDKLEVKSIPTLPSEMSSIDTAAVNRIQQRRAEALDLLRNLGDFNHNVTVLAKRFGTLIVGKRNQHSNPADFLPCSGCYVFYLKNELWRHCKKCKFVKNRNQNEDENIAAKHNITTSRLLLYGAGGQMFDQELESDFKKYVIDSLIRDEVSLAVINDKLLIDLGKAQFEKLGTLRASDVRAKLRILGRVKLELRKIDCQDYMEDYLTAQYFDTCVNAVKQLGVVAEGQKSLSGTDVFKKPDLVLKAGQLLKKVAILKRGKALRSNDNIKKGEADGFIDLYVGEWADKIGGIARQSIRQSKYNKKIVLPMTEDVVKLSNELDKSLKVAMAKLTKHAGEVDKQTWLKLAKVLLARITIFNKRRGNEPSQMLLQSWNWIDESQHHNKEIQMTLTAVEKHLLGRMYLIEILGKQNRKVPVLLTEEMKEAFNLLNNTREKAGIPARNPYVFPQGNEGHLSGCQCVREAADACNLQKPKLITTTLLRKYTATVAQILNLSENDVGELARHLGHELAVHRKFYRLQEDVTELTKISKLLLLIDGGKVSQFQAKDLDDVTINDLFPEVSLAEEKIHDEQMESDEENDNISDNIVSTTVTDNNRKRLRKTVLVEEPSKRELEDAEDWSDDSRDPDFNPSGSAEETDAYDSNCDSTTVVKRAVKRKVKVKTSSDSDTDSHVASSKNHQKRKRLTAERTDWSKEEISAIEKYLMPSVKRSGKPPIKAEIINMLDLAAVPSLKRRKWTSVKFRCWAMFQKHLKEMNKLFKR